MNSALSPSRRPAPKGLLLTTIVALVLVPVLLLGALRITTQEFARGRTLRAAVDRSYEERLQIQTVFSLMQDAETGQRGFVLTGQAQFLAPYENALARLGAERRKLRVMVAADREASEARAEQAHELAAVERLIDAKLANMAETIDLTQAGQGTLAQTRVASGEGKRIMDEIRAHMAVMVAGEAKALRARIAESEVRTHATERKVVALFAALAGLLLLASYLGLKQARGRQKLLSEVEAIAARKQAIFDSAQDGLVTLNRSGTIESINRAAEAMFGYGERELNRRDAGLLLELPDQAEFFMDRLTKGRSIGGVHEFVARRRDGTTFPAEVSLGTFGAGGDLQVVAAVRDITERRRVETLKSEFVSTVSHELRTPLTSIAGSLGLMVGGAAGALPEKAGRLLGIAHANCQRLVRLINDILDIEKIESGKMSFQMAPIDLADIARRAIEATAGAAAENGVRFELAADAGSRPVRGDADRLTQVAVNLLSNAAKFSPEGGAVVVTVTATTAGQVRLSVRDQGPGVPIAFQDRIFGKFAQADSSDQRQKGGTGLGLAISREIVERHGGRLWFDSPPGEGATFHADLPALAENVPAKASAADGPRALICEDDADAAVVLGEQLRGEGFRVEVAASVAEAKAALGEGRYDVLLLDVGLPDGSGLDLLSHLRELEGAQELPVLIVSGEAGASQPVEVLDWLQKPVDARRLRAALQRAVGLDPQELPVVLHVEDDSDVRQIVSDVLSAHCRVVAAESVAEARDWLSKHEPAVAILDIALADGSGLEVLPDLRRNRSAPPPVIIFSAQPLQDETLAASVDAILTKSRTSIEHLGDTVRRLASRASDRAKESA